ncbi:MAG: AAA family ATPase [Pseudomonadota bacterium]
MFLEHFGFSSEPFKLTPDPRFFYGSKSHNKAMAYLHYGLRQGDGFIVVTGEIGAGKSMLITHLLDQVDRTNVIAADLITPNLQPNELLSHILSAFRIEPAADGPTAEIEAFEDFLFDQLNRGRRVLLIVDEAQNLPKETLEELRVLSNLDYDGTPLFQVFLIGQPDFKPIIGADGMEQLRQRIIASYHLEPLSEEDVESYIRHRLTVVGWDNNPQIENAAYGVVLEATGGVPRRINKLFNRVLLHCAIEDLDVVTDEVVRTVVNDIADEDVTGREKAIGEGAPPKQTEAPLMNGVATEMLADDGSSDNKTETSGLDAQKHPNPESDQNSETLEGTLTDREQLDANSQEIGAADDSNELFPAMAEGRSDDLGIADDTRDDMPSDISTRSEVEGPSKDHDSDSSGNPAGALALAAGGVLSAFGLSSRKEKTKPRNDTDSELREGFNPSNDSADTIGEQYNED